MDQVKVILAGLKKYHFWVVCGVVILLGLVMWTMATADLEDRTKARATQIQKAKSDVGGLTSGKTLVNQGVIDVDQKETDKVHEEAQKAWESLYTYQKEKNDWPAALGPAFHDMISAPEMQTPDAEIPLEYRQLYQNFIDDHFPNVYEIIDIRVNAKLDANGRIMKDAQGRPIKIDPLDKKSSEENTVMIRGAGGESNQTVLAPKFGKVYWDERDLRRVKGQFKEGATQSENGELQWGSTPTTRQVRLAQEDLWVYQALLRTIAATNATQTYFHKMPIKRIDALEIAQAAADSFVKAESRLLNQSGGGGPGGGRIETGAQAAAAAKMGPVAATDGPGGPRRSEATSLTDYRYVNQVGKPLRADEKPPFEEYNMMPIHMRLLINQRKIVSLLVNLANSSMPIEVRRVSIRPGEQGASIDFGRFAPSREPGGRGGPGMLSPPGPNMPSAGFMSGGEGSHYGGGPASRSGGGADRYSESDQLSADERDPLDLPIDIDGIIYIFNVPKKEKLGTGSVATAAAAATTPPVAGATPAASGTPRAAPAAPGTAPAAPNAARPTPGAAPAVPGAAPATPGAAPAAPGTMPAAPGAPVPAAGMPGAAPAAPGTPPVPPAGRPVGRGP